MLPLQTIATGSKRADNTLTVAVMDKDANPIESAVLFIDDDHQTEMVTDANGAASYLLPDGTYTVYSYAANYLDRVVPVTIDGDDLQVDIVHRDAISWSTAPANAPIGVGEANGVRLAAAGDKCTCTPHSVAPRAQPTTGRCSLSSNTTRRPTAGHNSRMPRTGDYTVSPPRTGLPPTVTMPSISCVGSPVDNGHGWRDMT